MKLNIKIDSTYLDLLMMTM